MLKRRWSLKIVLPVLLLGVSGAMASLSGTGLSAHHADQLFINFSFTVGLAELYLVFFLVAITCIAAAIAFNPGMLFRNNIERD